MTEYNFKTEKILKIPDSNKKDFKKGPEFQGLDHFVVLYSSGPAWCSTCNLHKSAYGGGGKKYGH
jgi:hypothetical protein